MRAAVRLTALIAAALAASILMTGEPGAQESGRPYQIAPDATLPAFGSDRLQVVAPQPRVRVTDGEVDNLRQRSRSLRRSIDAADDEGGPTQATQTVTDDSRRTSPSTRTRPARTSARTSGSRSRTASAEAPTPDRMTMRRAPGNELNEQGPIQYGRLIVITGFENVNVTIDGQPYPYESMEGVLLYAGEQYEVVLEQAEEEGGSRSGDEGPPSRAIPIRLDPGETRVLMANLGGESSGRAPARPTSRDRASSARARQESSSDEEIGYLGVSSSPRGIVYVDGDNTGQMTPARRIELEPGRHEVRIFYESEDEFSETKNVLIREGVNTNVFFRLRRDEPEDGSDED